MDIQIFSNKIAMRPSSTKNTSISMPLSKKISKDLLNQIYPLDFAGIYRIGSKTNVNDCYVSSSYNIGKTVREHINLLINNKHYSKLLQEWVNVNGIEKITVTILKWCPSNTNLARQLEETYINLYEPKFNIITHEPVLTKKEMDEERSEWKPTYIFVDENDEITRIRGDITNLPKVKKYWSDVEITEMPVTRRNIGFNAR